MCLCVPPCRRLDTYLPDPTPSCVLNFGRPSLEISKELDQQNKMLDNVNTDLEEAIGGLDVVTKKTKDLIKKSGEGGGVLRLPLQWRVVPIDDTPVCNAVPACVLCEPGFRSGEASNVRHRNTYHLHAASSAGLGHIGLRWVGLGWVGCGAGGVRCGRVVSFVVRSQATKKVVFVPAGSLCCIADAEVGRVRETCV